MAENNDVIYEMLEDIAKCKAPFKEEERAKIFALSILNMRKDVKDVKNKVDRIEKYLFLLLVTVIASGIINLVWVR